MSKKRKKKDNVTYTKKANSSEYVSSENVNAWRNEPGVNEPLRIGRALRTRDEFFMGQKGKIIHPEQHPDELYRRVVTLEIDDNKNLAVAQTKRSNSRNGIAIPKDKQNRKYIQDPLTLDSNQKPIRIKKGRFELAPSSEDVTSEQANLMLEAIEQKSPQNKKRMALFRKNKKG